MPLTLSNHYVDLAITATLTLDGSNPGRGVVDDSGLTLTTTSPGSTVTVSGSAADMVTALSSRLSWEVPAVGGDSVVSVHLEQALPADTAYVPDNGHLYRPLLGDYTWYSASDSAAATSPWGRTGYLATITSPAEN